MERHRVELSSVRCVVVREVGDWLLVTALRNEGWCTAATAHNHPLLPTQTHCTQSDMIRVHVGFVVL
jgi:hypothetical protein